MQWTPELEHKSERLFFTVAKGFKESDGILAELRCSDHITVYNSLVYIFTPTSHTSFCFTDSESKELQGAFNFEHFYLKNGLSPGCIVYSSMGESHVNIQTAAFSQFAKLHLDLSR